MSKRPRKRKQGWECPRCHKVYAPHVNSCDCSPTLEQIKYQPLPMMPYAITSTQWPLLNPRTGLPYEWWDPNNPYRITVTMNGGHTR